MGPGLLPRESGLDIEKENRVGQPWAKLLDHMRAQIPPVEHYVGKPTPLNVCVWAGEVLTVLN